MHTQRPLIHILLLLLATPISPVLNAAQSDRTQPVQIEADQVQFDDRTKKHTFEGKVKLHQGSLEIRSHKMVVIQGDNGFASGIASGSAKSPAVFQQKREDGGWIKGQAQRIEYDARSERARLFGGAHIRSGADEISGEFIEYNAATEQYFASRSKDKGGRVRAVIAPRKK